MIWIYYDTSTIKVLVLCLRKTSFGELFKNLRLDGPRFWWPLKGLHWRHADLEPPVVALGKLHASTLQVWMLLLDADTIKHAFFGHQLYNRWFVFNDCPLSIVIGRACFESNQSAARLEPLKGTYSFYWLSICWQNSPCIGTCNYCIITCLPANIYRNNVTQAKWCHSHEWIWSWWLATTKSKSRHKKASWVCCSLRILDLMTNQF